MKTILFAILLLMPIVACNSRKFELTGPVRHYQLSGKVIGLNAKEQTATVDASAVPGFMEAMTMDYPIASKAEFQTLRVGDKIKATLNVSASGDEYNLTAIQKQNASQ